MSRTIIGDSNSSGGLRVYGSIQVGSTTVIDANGKLIESAGIEIADGDTFKDTNGNEIVEFTVTASAVNHVGIVNSAAGALTGISVNAAADVKTVYLNYADTWAGADTLTATGTIVLKWTNMS